MSSSEQATHTSPERLAVGEQASPAARRRPVLPLLISLALALLTLTAYWPLWAESYEFINLDDDEYVTANPHVQGGLNVANLWWALSAFHSNNWHPLTWLSLQLDAELYGLDPWGFHLSNLLLHTANAVVLFLALRRLSGATWRSAAAAALFAVHPLRVESVAWVAERKDVLSAFFGLLTLWAYAGYAARPGAIRYLLVVLLFTLGLLAKPMLVTLPCLLLLLDYWPLGRLRIERSAPTYRLVLEKLPLLALALGCSFLTVRAQQHIVQPQTLFPLSARLGNAIVSYVAYLGSWAWPVNLAPLYPHPGRGLAAAQVAGAGAVLLGVTFLALRARRYPYLAVGWFWYLGTLVPVLGLIQVGVQARADRYTYLPTIGILIALVWGTRDLVTAWRWPRAVPATAAALALAACVAGTWRQLPVWRDSVTLWEHAAAVTEQNWVAQLGLGKALDQQGDVQGAERHFARAVQIMPQGAIAHDLFGEFLKRRGKADEACREFAAALEVSPEYAEPHWHLGTIRAGQGRLQEAFAHFEAVLAAEPNHAGAHYNLGLLLARTRQLDRARDHFAAAVRARPDDAEAHAQLGGTLLILGDLGGAAEQSSKALEIDPGLAAAETNLGAVCWQRGEIGDAERHFRRAVVLEPGYVPAGFNLAVVLERQGRPEEAERQLRMVLRLDPRHPGAHYQLGLACEKRGLLREARRHFEAALAVEPQFEGAQTALARVRQGG